MDPARQNEIEIATESVDPDSLSIVRARQHCYQVSLILHISDFGKNLSIEAVSLNFGIMTMSHGD